MKNLMELCVLASLLIGPACAQQRAKPAPVKGISVQMPVANHAVEMRAADEPDATVVAITAEGKVYAGIVPTEPTALNSLTAETVYLKADARAPFQTVLAVLDGLGGKSVVLLSASPGNAKAGEIVAPYGIRLAVHR